MNIYIVREILIFSWAAVFFFNYCICCISSWIFCWIIKRVIGKNQSFLLYHFTFTSFCFQRVFFKCWSKTLNSQTLDTGHWSRFDITRTHTFSRTVTHLNSKSWDPKNSINLKNPWVKKRFKTYLKVKKTLYISIYIYVHISDIYILSINKPEMN